MVYPAALVITRERVRDNLIDGSGWGFPPLVPQLQQIAVREIGGTRQTFLSFAGCHALTSSNYQNRRDRLAQAAHRSLRLACSSGARIEISATAEAQRRTG
jgi:hypothetical protein